MFDNEHGIGNPSRLCSISLGLPRRDRRRSLFVQRERSTAGESRRDHAVARSSCTTMPNPKISMRYCAGSKSSPKILFRKSSSRRILSAADHQRSREGNADLRAHATEDDDGENSRQFEEGETVRIDVIFTHCKKRAGKSANIAPSAKAVSLVLVVLMPSERQAISSSRKASQARPTGKRRSLRVTTLVRSARQRMR